MYNPFLAQAASPSALVPQFRSPGIFGALAQQGAGLADPRFVLTSAPTTAAGPLPVPVSAPQKPPTMRPTRPVKGQSARDDKPARMLDGFEGLGLPGGKPPVRDPRPPGAPPMSLSDTAVAQARQDKGLSAPDKGAAAFMPREDGEPQSRLGRLGDAVDGLLSPETTDRLAMFAGIYDAGRAKWLGQWDDGRPAGWGAAADAMQTYADRGEARAIRAEERARAEAAEQRAQAEEDRRAKEAERDSERFGWQAAEAQDTLAQIEAAQGDRDRLAAYRASVLADETQPAPLRQLAASGMSDAQFGQSAAALTLESITAAPAVLPGQRFNPLTGQIEVVNPEAYEIARRARSAGSGGVGGGRFAYASPEQAESLLGYRPNGPVEVNLRTGQIRMAPGATATTAPADLAGRLTLGLPNVIAAEQAMQDLMRGADGTDYARNPCAEEWGARALDVVPFDGGVFSRAAGSDRYRQFDQAFRTFESSILPIFSGAAVTESEATRFVRANLPSMTDTPEVARAKAMNRMRISNGGMMLLGQPLPFPDAGVWIPPSLSAQQQGARGAGQQAAAAPPDLSNLSDEQINDLIARLEGSQ